MLHYKAAESVCTVNVGGVGGVESEFGGGGGGKSVEEARNSSS